MEKHVYPYMIGGLLMVLGMLSGQIVEHHLVVTGLGADALKAGSLLVICGWVIEFIQGLTSPKKRA